MINIGRTNAEKSSVLLVFSHPQPELEINWIPQRVPGWFYTILLVLASFLLLLQEQIMCFKTVKAFFRLKANDLCIDAQPMNLWRASSMMLYLFSFCGSTWKVFGNGQLFTSINCTGRTRPLRSHEAAPNMQTTRKLTHSVSARARANPRVGIEFQMEQEKVFSRLVPHPYFIMTLIWIH